MKHRKSILLPLFVLLVVWCAASASQSAGGPEEIEVTITVTDQIMFSDGAGDEQGEDGAPPATAPATGTQDFGPADTSAGGSATGTVATDDPGVAADSQPAGTPDDTPDDTTGGQQTSGDESGPADTYQPELSTDDASLDFGGGYGSAGSGAAAAAPTVEYVEILVTQTTTITFSDGSDYEPEVTTDDGALVFSGDGTPAGAPAAGDTETEVQYVEIVVTQSVTVTFAEPETETAAEGGTETETETCGPPDISALTINGVEASPGGEMALESDSPCDPLKDVTIKWKALSNCADIKEVSITADGVSKSFEGVEQGTEFEGTHEMKIQDSDQHKIVISAKDENDKESKIEYTIAVSEIDELPKPEFSEVTVNGRAAEKGSIIDIESTDCGDMKLEIKGQAAATCGEIQSISVEAGGSAAQVEGKESWEAGTTFDEPDTYTIIIKAKDSYNTESEEYEFDVQLTKSVQPPSVTIETISNVVVPDFGGEMQLNKGNLINDRLQIAGSANQAQCEIAKVEVSTDSGASWFEAEDTLSWTYEFKPSEGDYEIIARAVDTGGAESEEMLSPIELKYVDRTEEEAIREVFDNMMQAYEDKDVDTFIENVDDTFSTSYDSIEDKSRLEQALDDKFTEQGVVDIVYQVRTTIVSGTTGRIEFDWDTDTTSITYTYTGIWVFNKEDSGWMLLTVEDDNTFLKHSGAAASISVTDVYYDSVTGTLTANGYDAAELTIFVADGAGNPVRDGTEVLLSVDKGIIDSVVTTMEGYAEAVYTTGSSYGTVIVNMQSGGVTKTHMLLVEAEQPPDFPDEPER